MNWLKRIFLRQRLYDDLQEEMQQHLEERAAELTAGGMNPDQALRAARREFGNRTLLEEQGREVWQWTSVENLGRDVRFSIRRLSKVPGLTVVCILTLALGLGASVALFSVVHAVLLKPLPFKDSDRLVMLYEGDPQGSPNVFNQVAGGNFGEWQRESHSFEQMALWGWTSRNFSSRGGQFPEELQARLCTWNLFATLQVQPAYGRAFSASDDSRQANATTILSWNLFQRRFAGDPSILGKAVLLDGKPYTVIGIMPRWLNYPDPKTQLWLPAYHEQAPNVMQSHGMHKWNVVARLKPGVTDAAARSEVSGIQMRIHERYPNEPAMKGAQIRPLVDDMVRGYKTPLYVLLGAVGCVLLITCLNVANLLVARAAVRRKEFSIRAALGGTRWRLIREQMIESVLLASGGGILGVALASAGIYWILSTRTDLPRGESVHMDFTVLAFTFGITLLSGLIAGLLPATSTSLGSLTKALHESSRSLSASRSHARLRRTLLGAEVAFTVILLIGAGLLVKSFFRLQSVHLGFATKNILTMSFALRGAKYSTPSQKTAFFEELTNRVRALPGVQDAGLVTWLPGSGYRGDDIFAIPEHPPLPRGQFQASIDHGAGPAFFATMQIPLLRGRTFTDADRLERAHVAVVSQDFARTFFPHEDPLGRHIRLLAWSGEYEIVGIVGDTPYLVSQPIRPMMYFPLYEGTQFNEASLVVRSAGNPLALALPIQKQIAKIDPNVAVANILTMDQVIGQSTAAAAFNTYLILAFAGLSLLLAAMGLYGVLSYIVTQRTNEMGIRIALGAQRSELLRLMLFDGLKPAFVGLLFGLAGSAAVGRLIESMLFGVHPLDAAIFAGVPVLLLAVAAIACLSPALRASKTDPIEALRLE
jgi:predicted permease